MYKVEQLYVVFDDGDGHRHLIPKEFYGAFEKNYEYIDEAFSEHRDYEIFCEERDDLLDHFSNHRLEGESYYVVLDDHVAELPNLSYSDIRNLEDNEQLLVFYLDQYCGRSKKGQNLSKVDIETMIINNGFYGAEVRSAFEYNAKFKIVKV